MPVKLITSDQLELLHEGDRLQKFPLQGKPEDLFDETRETDIETYEISNINHKEQVIRLMVVDDETFIWPGDVEYLRIPSASMLAEKLWWVG